MQLGIVVRNFGPQSEPDLLVACARAAEVAGLESLWVADHLAIPPEDAEGSNGRYLDPLATLAHLAALTERIRLGTGVLILPYRPALPTLKWIASVQELSRERLLLGVGVGWMGAEFRALGVDRSRRGALTDAMLEAFRCCFASDTVEMNGQPLLFRPRPKAPPLFVGGGGEHALERTLRFGDGWMPMGADPVALEKPIAQLQRRAEAMGRTTPEVVAMGALPLDAPDQARAQLSQLSQIGVTRFVLGTGRYGDVEAFRRSAEDLANWGAALSS